MHAQQYEAWKGSHHALAMQVADDKTVLGNFANAKFRYAGITSTFFRPEINVACEACHGPGSNHVAWAKKEGDWKRFDAPARGFAVAYDERKGVAWTIDAASGNAVRSRPRDTAKEIEACARFAWLLSFPSSRCFAGDRDSGELRGIEQLPEYN